MALCLLLLALPSAMAATWYVDPAGGGDSATVQGAIDLASSGDTIAIAAGTYIEGIDLGGRDLTLEGVGAGSTVLGGTGIATCLTATAGERLAASDLSLSGCDSLLVASGATFDFTAVELWGPGEGGSFEGGSWDWFGGGVAWLSESGVAVDSASLAWDGLTLELNEVTAPLLSCADCDATLTGLEVADNTLEDTSYTYPGLLTFDGGTLSVQGLTAHDNTAGSRSNGVLRVLDGAEAEILDSWFYGDTSAYTYAGVSISGSSSVLATERCLFEDAYGRVVSANGSYSSLDDTFDLGGGASTALYLSGAGPLMVDGSTFTGFAAGASLANLSVTGALLTGITADGGSIYASQSATVEGSDFSGPFSVGGQITVQDSRLTGPGDTLVTSGTVSLSSVTVSGYDTAVSSTATVSDSVFTGIGTFSDSGHTLHVARSYIETTGDAFNREHGTLVIEDSGVVSAARGLDLSGSQDATLSGTTVYAGTSGIVFDADGALTLADTEVEARNVGLRVIESHTYAPTILIEDSALTSTAYDALILDGASPRSLTITHTTLVAHDAGISHTGDAFGLSLEDVVVEAGGDGFTSSGWPTLTIAGLDITAGGAGITTGGYIYGSDLAVDAGDDCVEAHEISVDGASLTCATDGLVTTNQTLANAAIAPGGACASAHSATWRDVTCRGAAGTSPLDLENASLTDVLVEGCSTARPSRFSGGTFTLDGLRFVGNTTTAGAGALALEDAEVTAVQVGFEDNQGVAAGALAVTGTSTLDLQGGLFRGNTASARPGAVLDEVGGSYACVLFQENAGEAGDVQLTDPMATIRNATFVGSSSSATGSLHLDAGWATVTNSIVAHAQAGWGVYADAAFRTAYLTYDDVWANAGGAWGGGLAAPTGTNGNQEADPGFVAYSADGDWTNDDLSLAPGSVLMDAGSPAWPDLDGSVGDLGAYGSACAGLLDYDSDGRSPVDGDCDDLDPTVHDLADEVCDGLDNDCDELVDDDDPDLVATAWCPDADADGWGDAARAEVACTAPSGWVALCGDCDEGDPSIHPGATEHCDGVDEDCDGLVDDDAADGTPFYADRDHDGYGDPGSVLHTCDGVAPAGYVADASDCDDTDPTMHDTAVWHPDADADGYGDQAVTLEQCEGPPGWIHDGTDCDDDDPDAWPGAPEVVGDGIDQDCDGEDPGVSLAALEVGDLVITEMMLEPSQVHHDVGVWIEIENLAGQTVNLAGLLIKHGDTGVSPVTCEHTLPRDAHFVIAPVDDPEVNGGVPVDCAVTTGTLSMAYGRLALRANHEDLDTVVWDDDDNPFAWQAGASLALEPDAADATLNDNGVYWCPSTSVYGDGGRGTPGEVNDPCFGDTGLDSGGPGESGLPGDRFLGGGGCRCSSGSTGGVGWLLPALLGLVGGRRRRFTASPTAPPPPPPARDP
ncbi:MAG: MopE-related protein [Pseudomonadota bacterium]